MKTVLFFIYLKHRQGQCKIDRGWEKEIPLRKILNAGT